MNAKEILKDLIKYKTITPKEEKIYDYISSLLHNFQVLEFHKEDVKNIFLYKKFGDGIHLNFAGHIDVVPAGDGWESDPFNPIEKDGFIYGRGTQDMKGGVAAFLSACKSIKEFNGTLSILLTSDEEGEAIHGTVHALESLKKMNFLPDVCIVAEPTCEKEFGDAIKVGRRGSINGYLEIQGSSGHAAYPEKANNPLHNSFGEFLTKVAGVDLDDGDEYFAPSKFVVTDLRAGYEVTNLTPGKLNMMFNVRNSTKTTKDDVEAFVKSALKDLNIKDYTLKLTQGSFPFVTKDGKYSKLLVESIKNSVQEITGITPKDSTAGGTSDARFISAYGIDVVELGVVNSRIHAPNERVPTEEIDSLEKVFQRVLTHF